MTREAFLQAIGDLAGAYGTVAYIIVAVTPSEEGFAITASAASRLDEEDVAEVMASAQNAVDQAVGQLRGAKAEKIDKSMLN